MSGAPIASSLRVAAVNAPSPGEAAAARAVAVSTTAFLLVAPVTSSSGLRMGLLVAAALALGHLAWHHGRDRLAGPLPAGLAIAFGAWALLALASAAWSVNPAYSLGEFKREVGYNAFAFGVFFLAARSPARVRLWAGALLAGALLLGLFEIARASAVPQWDFWHGGPGRFSTHLALVAPLALLVVARPPEGFGRGRTALATLLAVLFVVTLDTRNRMAWIAYLAALAVLAATLAPMVTPVARRRAAVAVLALGVALAGLFAISVVQKSEEFYPQAGSARESLELDLRPTLWRLAGAAIEERPWLGHGFGREILEPRFRAGAGEANREYATHAHNVFLNVTISLGFPGLALFVVLIGALVHAHGRRLANPGTRVLAALGLAVVTAFVVKSLTDDFFGRHNALVFWALNGMLLGPGARAR